MNVYACLLLCFMLVLASLVLGFATFDTLSGFMVVWLHLAPMRPCSNVTTCWLYMHIYTLAYMSMHESCLLVCHPCFNTMKLWTSNQNLHLSLTDNTFCLLSYLLVCYLTCLPTLFICYLFCSFACIHAMFAMSIMLTCFMLFHMLFALSFHCLSGGFLVFALACTHMVIGQK